MNATNDQLFDPPTSVLVINQDGEEDRFDDVTAVKFGLFGSLNVQQGQEQATLYRKWQSWKVIGISN